MHSKLWALADTLVDVVPGPPAHAVLAPYDSIAELVIDLEVVADSLRSHGADELAEARVDPVRRAVEIFGTHLCGLDMRQNSSVHEVVVAELLRVAGVTDDYLDIARVRADRSAGERVAQPTSVDQPLRHVLGGHHR